jgi:hypothetical protein
MIKGCLIAIFAIALAFSVIYAEAGIGMLIFNWVMGLFNCAFTITFWQSFGICILLSFIGGFFRTSVKINKD